MVDLYKPSRLTPSYCHDAAMILKQARSFQKSPQMKECFGRLARQEGIYTLSLPRCPLNLSRSVSIVCLRTKLRSAKLTLLYVKVFDDEWCPDGDGDNLPEGP